MISPNPQELDPASLKQRQIGPVSVLFGHKQGKYPYGNTAVVRGENMSVIIDPSLGMVPRRAHLPAVDKILLSHAHEDHCAGAHLYPDLPCCIHAGDAPGIESLDGLGALYGFTGEAAEQLRKYVEADFYYRPRAIVELIDDGDVLDLGGTSIEVIYTPGHTRGHCCFLVRWGSGAHHEQLVCLGDIELSSFGPVYGDPASDLEEFERSIQRLKQIDAKYWLTFHHKGLIEDRDSFLALLDDFERVIHRREQRLLDFIDTPKTLEQIVAHRIVYRPGTADPAIDFVEKRSSQLHLQRLLRDGVIEKMDERYVAIAG